jgi:hypothetical protein
MEAAGASKMLVATYESTCHNPQDHCHENIKSHTCKCYFHKQAQACTPLHLLVSQKCGHQPKKNDVLMMMMMMSMV